MLELVNRLDSRVLLGVFLAIVNVWCLALLWRSTAGRRDKWLWSAVILFCPIIGCLFWYVLGPRPNLLGRQ